MDTIAGFSDSYEISNTSSTSFGIKNHTDSSIVYPAELLTVPEISALQLLANSLESIFDSPEEFYSDAKLVLAEGKEVFFHRCVLSARSPFLKSELASAKKKQEESTIVKLDLKEIAKDYEVGFDSVVAVLAYAYSGRVRPPPKGVSDCVDEECCHVSCRPAVGFMVEVLYLAFVFQIPELVTLYQRHLLNIVDMVVIEDILVILKVANICGETCKKLFDKCTVIIVKSNVDITSLEKSLSQETVKHITDIRKDLGMEALEVEKPVSNILKALDSDDVELLKLLLLEGNTNLDDAYALHFAVSYCDVNTTMELLDLGLADVNHRNPRGYTVLHVAAMRKEPPLIVSLLEKGACPSATTLEGKTALLIAKRFTKAADYNNNTPEQGKLSHKDRVCIDVLEDADKHGPLSGETSPYLAVAADEMKMRLLDLENRVALAQLLFPMEAQVATDIAKVKGTCEFTVTSLETVSGSKRTSQNLTITPFRIQEKHLSRLKVLSKTVELGKRFFPRCSAVLDQIMGSEDLSHLACVEEDTPEKRLQKKQRFMELQETLMKAFIEDKEEFGKSTLSASSSCTLKSTAGIKSNGKVTHRRRCVSNH